MALVTDLSEYGKKYPDLVVDIVNFFRDTSIQSFQYDNLKKSIGGDFAKMIKSSMDFSIKFGQNEKKYFEISNDRELIIQPKTITRICNILCENNVLEKVHPAMFTSFAEINFYMRMGEKIDNPVVKEHLNNIVYGFKYIYEKNKLRVLPVYVRKGEDKFTGTCFKSCIGIVTAKHCIEDCNAVCIQGVDLSILKNAKIKAIDGLDIIVIVPQNYNFMENLLIDTGDVLDETMSLGFPNHAGFGNFLTATTGQIATIEKSYLCNYELMLLTGKIKGGNSGGPVIDKNGRVVGIITETTASDGDYDKFGYGMAIPSAYITQVVDNGMIYNKSINFVDNI